MLDRLAWICNGNALSRLDPGHLKREEELWHFDREVSTFAADARLGSQVQIQIRLKGAEVRRCKGVRGGEGVEGEFQGGGRRGREVDG